MFTAQLSHRHAAFGLAQDRLSRSIALQPPAGQRMICASVYLLVFIQNLLMHLAEKILLMQHLTFRGITLCANKCATPVAVIREECELEYGMVGVKQSGLGREG